MDESDNTQFSKARNRIASIMFALDLERIDKKSAHSKLDEIETHFMSKSKINDMEKESIKSLFAVARLQINFFK